MKLSLSPSLYLSDNVEAPLSSIHLLLGVNSIEQLNIPILTFLEFFQGVSQFKENSIENSIEQLNVPPEDGSLAHSRYLSPCSLAG